MNALTKIGVGIFALFVAFSMVSQCGRKNSPPPPTPEKQAEIILKEYSKGLNLDAVTALAKKSKDAADFERLLNSQAEAVNNIDLNDDDKVDYIKVTEYGSGDRRGFSLTTEIYTDLDTLSLHDALPICLKNKQKSSSKNTPKVSI